MSERAWFRLRFLGNAAGFLLAFASFGAAEEPLKMDEKELAKAELVRFLDKLSLALKDGVEIMPSIGHATTLASLQNEYFACIKKEDLKELSRLLEKPSAMGQFDAGCGLRVFGRLKEAPLTYSRLELLASMSLSDELLMIRFVTMDPKFPFVDVLYTDPKVLEWFENRRIK